VITLPAREAGAISHRRLRRQRVVVILQYTLALVFALSGAEKILEGPGQSQWFLSELRWFPDILTPAVANSVPWIELALAAWLVSGRKPLCSTVSVLAVLFAYSIGLAAVGVRTGWSSPCGCLAIFREFTIAAALVRNAVLTALTVVLYLTLLREHHTSV
jgi:uncharacterized membrane protein YphA (DoxX/SURF4 family)